MRCIKQGKFKVYIFFVLAICFGLWVNFQLPYIKQASASHVDENLVHIESSSDLFKLADTTYVGTIFRLKNNIDLKTDTDWHAQVSDYQKGWRPLDTSAMTDCIFDGGGYAIENLSIDRASEYTGLFSKNSLQVKNLFITGTIIVGGENSGIFAGWNDGKVDNIHTTGNVSAASFCGGLIAENYGELNNCSFEGEISGKIIGGLIGLNESRLVSNCLTYGVASGHIVGGFIGQLNNSFEKSKVIDCFSDVEVIENRQSDGAVRLGAFIGVRDNGVAVDSCYSNDIRVAVAFGEHGGIVTLSIEEKTERISYQHLDFVNYWTWKEDEARLQQRTIAIESMTTNFEDIETSVLGDRKYYLVGEEAQLSLNNGEKSNLGIATLFINGNVHDWNAEKNFVTVSEQLNVQYMLEYLIFVQISIPNEYGKASLNKEYYAPNEKIELRVDLNEGATLKSIDSDIEFENLGNDTYVGYAPNAVFTNLSTLSLTINISAPSTFEYIYLLWITIVIAVIVLNSFALFHIRRKNESLKYEASHGKKSKFTSAKMFFIKLRVIFFSSILSSSFICGLVIWLLLVLRLISVTFQAFFVIVMPIAILSCLLVQWLLIRYFYAQKYLFSQSISPKHLSLKKEEQKRGAK